jgi:hypothetical protein
MTWETTGRILVAAAGVAAIAVAAVALMPIALMGGAWIAIAIGG